MMRNKPRALLHAAVCRVLLFAVMIIACTTSASAGTHSTDSIASFLNHTDTMSIESMTIRAYKTLCTENIQNPLALYKTCASRYSLSLSERERYFCVISMVNTGYIYLFYYHNPEQAYPYLARGLKTAKENNFISLVPGALDNLAKVHGDYGDTRTELLMLKEAFNLTVCPDQGVSYGIPNMHLSLRIMVFIDMVMTAVRHNMLDEISPETDIMTEAPIHDIHNSLYAHRVALALQLSRQGNYNAALDTLRAAKSMISDGSDYHRDVVNHFLLMSYISSMEGNTAEARHSLDEARTGAITNGIEDLLPRIYRRKAELTPDSTWHYMSLAALTRDSLYDVGGLVRIKDLENSVYIDELNRETAIEKERHRQRIYIIYILVGALLVTGAMGAVVLYRNRQLSQANRTLVRNSRKETDTRELEKKLRQAIPVDEQEKMRLAALVRDILESDQRVFDPDFGLENLAALSGTKPKYLSTIINEVFGRNLSTLLAEVRIREASRRLADPATTSSLTIDAIAASVGYKSRTHFSTLFKKITGVSPSQYAAIAASERKRDKMDI